MKFTQSLKQLIFGLTMLLLSGAALADRTILNVSYDPTRELYQAFNKEFIKYWKEKPEKRSMSSSPTAGAASRRGLSSTVWKRT
jgi:ABC-type sulfate transport system, periplasmic component